MNRILYLHGFASGPTSSKAQYFRALLESAGSTVEIPDLAAGDFEHLTLTSQLAIIEQLAAGQPISLMGSSMGGYLAAIYAARHPEVSRLVLLAPAFSFQTRWHQRYGAAAIEAWRTEGSVNVYHYVENREVPLSYGLLEDAARYEPYPEFHQPALLFHGAHDEVVPAEYSRDFARTHPNVQLQVVDSDHSLLNALDDIAPAIERFLAT